MTHITLPHKWQPRHYQVNLWNYFGRGGKRAVWCVHRRAGKDDVALHLTAKEMHKRVGVYWHMLPTAAQARKAIWEAINPHTGIRRIDEAFPKELRETTRENEMFIKFKNGSTWQVVGSDNFDSLVGSPPIGVVYSEYALASPKSWSYIRPILAENGGWALFISTPRGRNHMYNLVKEYADNPDWFVEVLTAKQTNAIGADVLENERREYVKDLGEAAGNALFNQEYMCSFDSAAIGAYYAGILDDGKDRVMDIPVVPGSPVYVSWDLGYGDSTALWFVQLVGREVRVVDFYQASGQPIDHYVKLVNSKPYNYELHFLPHDAEHNSLRTGTDLVGQLAGMGIPRHKIRTLTSANGVPPLGVDAGINLARTLLGHCYFDAKRCAEGLECLRAYSKSYDSKNKVFNERPLHDWSSDAADSFRYMAIGLAHFAGVAKRDPKKVDFRLQGGSWMG